MSGIRKNRIAKSAAALIGAAALLTGTIPALADENAVYRTVEEIQESGSVRIGVFSDKSPFGYVDEYGEYQGYDVYFARRIGEDLGVEIEYVSTEAANRIEYLQTGKVDIILANFTVTEERAEEVDFALPYMNVALGVVSPEDAVIESLDEIGEDQQVIVISGTTAETYLEKNNPEIRLQKYDAYAEAKTALENGNADAWANDNTEVIACPGRADAQEGEEDAFDEPQRAGGHLHAGGVGAGMALQFAVDGAEGHEAFLRQEAFFHQDYEETLLSTYGADYEDTLVVEGGVIAGEEEAETEA